MKYENIFIIGEGKVAKECQKIAELFFNQEVRLVIFKETSFLDSFFNSLKKSLIISANNFYIFKPLCVENNTIINYHNSLLPYYRGVNAHVWAIYKEELKTGITWHKVDKNIDTGDILIQEEIELDKKITALNLLRVQHNLAINVFKKALENLKNKNYKKQDECLTGGGIYLKKDLPNGGFLELSWEKSKIDCFLRAMDCGILSNIPKAKIKLFNQNLNILFYEYNKDSLKLHLENDIILKINKNL